MLKCAAMRTSLTDSAVKPIVLSIEYSVSDSDLHNLYLMDAAIVRCLYIYIYIWLVSFVSIYI